MHYYYFFTEKNEIGFIMGNVCLGKDSKVLDTSALSNAMGHMNRYRTIVTEQFNGAS
jgi:hypothetical protein